MADEIFSSAIFLHTNSPYAVERESLIPLPLPPPGGGKGSQRAALLEKPLAPLDKGLRMYTPALRKVRY